MSSTTVPNPANGSFPSRSSRLSAGWGCLLKDEDDEEVSLFLFEKTALLDKSTPPEETEKNRIRLGQNDLVDMNTTGLVFLQNQGQEYLRKKDFWMSGNTQTNT